MTWFVFGVCYVLLCTYHSNMSSYSIVVWSTASDSGGYVFDSNNGRVLLVLVLLEKLIFYPYICFVHRINRLVCRSIVVKSPLQTLEVVGSVPRSCIFFLLTLILHGFFISLTCYHTFYFLLFLYLGHVK